MIETVIKEIRDAEARADEMQKNAYQRGKQIVLDAEAEAERQKRSIVQECKADRKQALATAREMADNETRAILKREAENLYVLLEQKNSAIDAAADKVVATLIAKYVRQEEEI